MPQFRKLLSENKQAGAIHLKFPFRAVFSVIVLVALWLILKKQGQSIGEVLTITKYQLFNGRPVWLFVLLALVPVNWCLEAKKWQLLVGKVEKVTFLTALRSTLIGLLSGLVLPAQVGDIAGRVASLGIRQRSRTVGAAIISGGIQFYAAVFTGLISIYFVWERLRFSTAFFWIIVSVLSILILIGIGIFSARRPLLSRLPDKGLWTRVKPGLEVMAFYDNRELLRAFLTGLLRYLTYLAQFVAGIAFFDFPMSVIDMAACSALVLLVKTVMPAVNLFGDLGLRGVTAVFIFAKFGVQAEQVVAATLLIWLTNILIPALFGLFLVWRKE